MLSNKGFTLIETVIAIIILGFTLLVTSRMQVGSLIRFGRWRSEIDRVFLIKKELQEGIEVKLKKGEKFPENITVIKTHEEPQLKVTLNAKDISRKSSLAEFKDSLMVVEAIGEWKDGKDLRSMNMIRFTMIPSGKDGDQIKKRKS